MVEFVSYDGEYPNLCSGELKILVNKKEYILNNVLLSCGNVWLDNNCDEHVETGFWTVNTFYIPEELKQYIGEIELVVNENVEHGCCGGCI